VYPDLAYETPICNRAVQITVSDDFVTYFDRFVMKWPVLKRYNILGARRGEATFV